MNRLNTGRPRYTVVDCSVVLAENIGGGGYAAYIFSGTSMCGVLKKLYKTVKQLLQLVYGFYAFFLIIILLLYFRHCGLDYFAASSTAFNNESALYVQKKILRPAQ